MQYKVFILLALIGLTISSCPSAVSNNKLSAEQISSLLDKHNELRNKVASGNESPQPSAQDMREMIWDNELAELAQDYANTCPAGHNQQRQTESHKSVGENLYWSMSSRSSSSHDYSNAVQAWYDEVKDYSPKNTDVVNVGSNTGHYTQVVWAKTDKVGCGVSSYKDGKWYKTAVVCNYVKAGNFGGQALYQKGTAGGQCQKKSSQYSALCYTEGSENDDERQQDDQKDQDQNDKCEDNISSCGAFKKLGVCENQKYAAFVKDYCGETCAKCEKKDEHKGEDGEEDKDKEDNKEKEEEKEECADNIKSCDKLKELINVCTSSKYQKFTKEQCAKTCGHCGQKEGEDCSSAGKEYNGCFIKNKSIESCGQCTETAQCKVGFCCPYMKKCVATSQTGCRYPIANCRGGNCENKDYPTNWLTCQSKQC